MATTIGDVVKGLAVFERILGKNRCCVDAWMDTIGIHSGACNEDDVLGANAKALEEAGWSWNGNRWEIHL